MRVLLVDDHAVMRSSLLMLLSQEPDIEILGEAADGRAALEKTRALRPDALVMDVRMPGMDGAEAARVIHAEYPEVRIIGLTMYQSAEAIRPRAARPGADGERTA